MLLFTELMMQHSYISRKENLKSAYQNAVRAWVLCEGGIKDKSIHAEWKQLRTDYSQYIMTGGNKSATYQK